MKPRRHDQTPRPRPFSPAPALGWVALAALLVLIPTSPAPAATPTLTLEAVEVEGNTRTSDETAIRLLGLEPGQELTQGQLVAAVERLRERRAFSAVDFYTRRGAVRGSIIIVLEVAERGAQLRLGTGQSDLDGWYLIPLELSLDNQFGRGEEAALRLKFGYRHAGIDMHYREGTAPGDRWRWEIAADFRGTNRIYFDQGVEFAHQVNRNRLGFTIGRRLGSAWRIDLGLQFESVDTDSTGEVWQDNDLAGVSAGDEVAFADLPAGIAAGVGKRDRGIVIADLILDTREGSRAGSPARGLWGRLRLQSTEDQDRDEKYGAFSADLRAYRPAPGGVFVLRLGGGTVEELAPFYDRLYLGGLYTVRGVPSQSLSAPGGGTWLWNASVEYRAAMLGPIAKPRLTGSIFFDTGQSGGVDDEPSLDGAFSSIGWGLRYRVTGSLWVGGDFGIPLDDSPVDEAFHGHAALGWSF